RRGARARRPALLRRGARAPGARALMQAPLRYPELVQPPRAGTPESFWISLGYFNLYRVALATLFLTLSLVYRDELALGSEAPFLFRLWLAVYLVAAAPL